MVSRKLWMGMVVIRGDYLLILWNSYFLQCKAVLDKLRGAVNREGRTIAALFMELPKRNELPDYYRVITTPIDAHIIEHRLDHFEYPGVLDFAADVQLMLDNAVRYNQTAEVIRLLKCLVDATCSSINLNGHLSLHFTIISL
jgi:hypothetical protein